MPNGYNGKILRVNLSNRSTQVEEQGENFYRTYLGGRGIVAYYLLKELERGVDPLGPDNKVIFAAGLLAGAPVAGACRSSVGAKSPLTGAYGDAEAGGFWAVELKRAGYDAIIIEGQSKKPVYLWIHDGGVEIRDAGHLWGKPTLDVQKVLLKEVEDHRARVAQIGPGGERLVRYACVVHDLHHFAGRTGIGAVMGAKKLRAVVVRGSKLPPMAERDRVKAIARWFADNVQTLSGQFQKYGTGATVSDLNTLGGLPTRNFREGTFERADDLSGETMLNTILVDRRACYACPVRCKRVVEVKGGPYPVSAEYGGAEYETLAALGSNCGIGDLAAVSWANQLCAAHGLDTISTGAAIAFAMECAENGLLSDDQLQGLDLGFGNATAMVQLVQMIGERRGLGDLLAEGVQRAAEAIGGDAARYALHVKGQEVPMHEPRIKHGLGLGYAVSPTGADHVHNLHDTAFAQEGRGLNGVQALGVLEPLPVTDLSPAKVRLFVYRTMWMHAINSISMCLFVPFNYDQVVELVRGVTGWNTTVWELLKVGERTINMMQAFNVREGFGPGDDKLPDRFFTSLPDGMMQGVSINRGTFEKALERYYQMMSWDEDTGAPKDYKLEELGIGWVSDELRKR
jgi:aldehyde:ferredoxin oxidoreductase